MSWRKVATLISHLPADSAYARALNDDPWSTEEHLLAVIADRVGEAVWVTAQVNSKKKLDPPEPIPRPGRSNGHKHAPKEKPKQASIGDLKRFFGQPAGR